MYPNSNAKAVARYVRSGKNPKNWGLEGSVDVGFVSDFVQSRKQVPAAMRGIWTPLWSVMVGVEVVVGVVAVDAQISLEVASVKMIFFKVRTKMSVDVRVCFIMLGVIVT